MKRTNFPTRKEQRRKEAQERLKKWESLTPTEKIESLNSRLGVNKGAVKQRKRIQKELQKE